MTEQLFDSENFLKTLSAKPGIYQMYDAQQKILYVGKAKQLKNRVSSYFRSKGLAIKTQALVAKIASIQVTVTHTEAEALILEQNLIKKHRPPYNILMRDDKSYPYVYLSNDKYPQLSYHRGVKRGGGRYFGPYPSAGAVKESLNLLQKVFKVRQCDNSYFSNRSRPCLQHQINRCTAPCVEKISEQDYAESVKHTVMFLEGHNKTLIKELADEMEAAAADLEFEQAALLRDKIQHLQQVQATQTIDGAGGEVDIFACELSAGAICMQVLFVRGGRVLGSKSYFPKAHLDEQPGQVLSAFLAQFYLSPGSAREVPGQIVTSHEPEDQQVINEALNSFSQKQISISQNVRSARAQWLKLAQQSAQQNLNSHLANKQNIRSRFAALQEVLSLDQPPKRMECFDISHSSGEATVASCVVFDQNGPLKSDYRRFNIEGVTAGDDYAAMQQALKRRYARIKAGDEKMPDILFIDGGKGQVSQATQVLEELAIKGLMVVGIAKGTTRKAGFEYLYRPDTGDEFVLPSDSSALHLIQHIRDESHRFAITGHKQRRDKARRESPLEGIAGVGPKRRRELLRHFGGWQEVGAASADDLAKVPGISQKLAVDIYTALHNS
ncbi:excinuclease ABC subunit UvrC [Dasania marina]|uniref:excinuclease ABC subunit UvrC n=1 Tax=Dasania marina TaxID=471499 RepID=UPI0030D6F246|tara:strand:+ start:150543 stop:152372 length:1830 start_codon:yes stop_codon:yes gene_type:complete